MEILLAQWLTWLNWPLQGFRLLFWTMIWPRRPFGEMRLRADKMYYHLFCTICVTWHLIRLLCYNIFYNNLCHNRFKNIQRYFPLTKFIIYPYIKQSLFVSMLGSIFAFKFHCTLYRPFKDIYKTFMKAWFQKRKRNTFSIDESLSFDFVWYLWFTKLRFDVLRYGQ